MSRLAGSLGWRPAASRFCAHDCEMVPKTEGGFLSDSTATWLSPLPDYTCRLLKQMQTQTSLIIIKSFTAPESRTTDTGEINIATQTSHRTSYGNTKPHSGMSARLIDISWDVSTTFTTPDLDRPIVARSAIFDERVGHVSREIHRVLAALHGYDARFTSIEQEQAALRASVS